MVPSFGGRLRAERERRDLSLQAVAEETKIKVSVLEGLEEDDLSFWPSGLFRRAYVRAYARAIGLDPRAPYMSSSNSPRNRSNPSPTIPFGRHATS